MDSKVLMLLVATVVVAAQARCKYTDICEILRGKAYILHLGHAKISIIIKYYAIKHMTK